MGRTLLAKAGTPDEEAREEDLVPEESEEEDGDAGEAWEGNLEAAGRREQELGGAPQQDERQHEPRQHSRQAPRKPLHRTRVTHDRRSASFAA